jgi:gamma-glutamyltranspeptidase/glutathione hydrolase
MGLTAARRGIVAAGHSVTAEAGREMLAAGGNAFDAVLAAMLAACVAEPVLASLGGGGFLLARAAGRQPEVFDFFTQTPHRKRAPGDIEFRPILADFGTAQQEFHIGMGTIATPGVVAGLFAVHKALCSLPLAAIAEPAITAARTGVEVNAFQHYIATVVAPILQSRPTAFALHASPSDRRRLAATGEVLRHAACADTLEALVREGRALFYEGDISARVASDCRDAGGLIGSRDFSSYRVRRRAPLVHSYRENTLFLNPPPSVGGTLLAFTLALLAELPPGTSLETDEGMVAVAEAMLLTQGARADHELDFGLDEVRAGRLLNAGTLARYRGILRSVLNTRGTTHISVADHRGNLASLTLSNGEGSGYVVPHTGIMLNNMLGEEDLNARGFNQWPPNVRVGSMMSPTLAQAAEGNWYAIGSGGSNRIRSAILQTLLHILDGGLEVQEAVRRPRIHVEHGQLNIEHGFADSTLASLSARFPAARIWPDINLFFGGAHTAVSRADGSLAGAGDPRRGGIVRTARL